MENQLLRNLCGTLFLLYSIDTKSMAPRPKKKCSILSLLFLLFILQAHAQNLVPNPSFEDYTACPTGISSGFLECVPWQNANWATSDYYNACCGGCDVSVPDNWVGMQPAHTGLAYAGSIYKWDFEAWQEYLQVQLTEPCQAGYSYNVAFYVSLSDFYCGIEHVGVYLSVDPPPNNTTGVLAVQPQF
ncbi:MAG: hypothetical protein ABIQ11_01635, partial [Saprospiraceae bacterium]